ncbi:phage tail protein [Paenibacillus sp. PR3]|uniref:Phage tail protein n=1 Tax=Paenibacillus terricola TaxID=2763503 RepID=A0ABR8N5A4_9BACL|nr:phage baseplate assembly protein V [Paenibacillus terricola]MBD3922431.1 phage tail protein [Paenibacillus terricola]
MSLYELLQSESRSGDSRMNGVAIAIVTNIQDPENMGRVKVKYPWHGGEDESYWARIATLMAGKERGTYFLPEVGDEVLVAFEMGNIQFPYVLGALWNGEDKPPQDGGDGKNHIRQIKSRSGHELTFNDEDGKGSITLMTKSGHQIVLDDSSGGERIQIVDKSGSNKIVIDSAKSEITVESGMKLRMKAPTVELEADSMMTIKAGGTLTLKGALVQIN